jgi:hypothetical protein
MRLMVEDNVRAISSQAFRPGAWAAIPLSSPFPTFDISTGTRKPSRAHPLPYTVTSSSLSKTMTVGRWHHPRPASSAPLLSRGVISALSCIWHVVSLSSTYAIQPLPENLWCNLESNFLCPWVKSAREQWDAGKRQGDCRAVAVRWVGLGEDEVGFLFFPLLRVR